MVESSTRYSYPSEFEPLLPQRKRSELEESAADVVKRSLALTNAAHPTTLETLHGLLREMNSYYSNRIEGQHTHPHDIKQALIPDYSASGPVARLQRLAVAHIKAETTLENRGTRDALTMDFLKEAHRELYAHLGDDDLPVLDHALLVAGEFRTVDVSVGRHVAPTHESIAAFSRRFDDVYSKRYALDTTLIAVASAHHRASWIHPFPDGNGRAVRLQTHTALFPLTKGLWSISRGLARHHDEYYQHLAGADMPRAGDLDGRGNLSDQALHRWCEWFIDLCRDQVDFMTGMLRIDSVHNRLRALIAARASLDNNYRTETVLPLFHTFATGPCERGEFLRMTGLGERNARKALSHLLKVGLVTSPDHRAPIRIAFPLDALQLIFPDMYPDATTPTQQ